LKHAPRRSTKVSVFPPPPLSLSLLKRADSSIPARLLDGLLLPRPPAVYTVALNRRPLASPFFFFFAYRSCFFWSHIGKMPPGFLPLPLKSLTSRARLLVFSDRHRQLPPFLSTRFFFHIAKIPLALMSLGDPSIRHVRDKIYFYPSLLEKSNRSSFPPNKKRYSFEFHISEIGSVPSSPFDSL